MNWALTFITIAAVAFFFLVRQSVEYNQNQERLTQECMADGLKEYQCRAMMNRARGSHMVPIFLPVHQ